MQFRMGSLQTFYSKPLFISETNESFCVHNQYIKVYHPLVSAKHAQYTTAHWKFHTRRKSKKFVKWLYFRITIKLNLLRLLRSLIFTWGSQQEDTLVVGMNQGLGIHQAGGMH